MIIAERYEILGKIGTGGMADVYKAKDHKLNRFVAVKVLKPEFREDTTFIRKFRSEAQAAAGLTHPNIGNVFFQSDTFNKLHYNVINSLVIPYIKYIDDIRMCKAGCCLCLAAEFADKSCILSEFRF